MPNESGVQTEPAAPYYRTLNRAARPFLKTAFGVAGEKHPVDVGLFVVQNLEPRQCAIEETSKKMAAWRNLPNGNGNLPRTTFANGDWHRGHSAA
jgi:hypothetical protein